MSFAGQLRYKIQIQARTNGADEAGQPLDTWATVAEPWADIANQYGLEAIKAGAEASTVRVSIRLRYRTGIDARMRVLHNGATYRILAVLPDERGKQFVDLACELVQ